MCYFMKYDDFVNDPEKHIRWIYQFLDIPYFQHRYSNLQQLVVNGMSYNEEVVGKNMHTIRTEIKKEANPYIEKISQRIREKYGHIKF